MRYCYSLTADQFGHINRLDTDDRVGFEIRLDSLSEPIDTAQLRKATAKPLLATYRSKPHLGQGDVSFRDREGWSWRLNCLHEGYQWIDLELDEPELATKIDQIHEAGGQVVLSHHDLGKGESLEAALEKALATRADIIKLIGTGQQTSDFARQRRFYSQVGERALIHFYMGADYAATRVLSLLLGSPFTYLTPNAQTAVAPGQLTLESINNYSPLEIEPTKLSLFAVIGHPIGHSRSPAYHNPRLKAIEPNSLFIALPAQRDQDLEQLRETWPELKGMAVTKPMKAAAYRAASHFMDPDAAQLGAINTLLYQQNKVQATNTDQLAMVELLKAELPDGRVRVLGYGGLGKAVQAACRALGLTVELSNRTPNRIPAEIKAIPWASRHEQGPTVIVQATSAGMAPFTEISPLEYIPAGVTRLIETIYNPTETKLMRIAMEAGIEVTDGHALFDEQARIQNRIFKNALMQRA